MEIERTMINQTAPNEQETRYLLVLTYTGNKDNNNL